MKKINTFLGMLFCMLMISPQVYSAQESTEENAFDFTQQPSSTVNDLFAGIFEPNPSFNTDLTTSELPSLPCASFTMDEFQPPNISSFPLVAAFNGTINQPTFSAHQMPTKSSCLAGIHLVGPCGCKAPTRQFQPEHDSLAACEFLFNQNFLDEPIDLSSVFAFPIATELSEAQSINLTSHATAFDVELPTTNPPQEQIDGSRKPYSCDQCDKSFTQLFRLKRHQLIHIDKESGPCSVCGKIFEKWSALHYHKETAHTQLSTMNQASSEQVYGYTYDECNKNFDVLLQLTIHKRTHTGEKPYACSQCHYRSTQLSNLKRHERKNHTSNTQLPLYEDLQQPSAITTSQPEQSPLSNDSTQKITKATDLIELENNPSSSTHFTHTTSSLLTSESFVTDELLPIISPFALAAAFNRSMNQPTLSENQMPTKSSCLAGIHPTGPCGCRAKRPFEEVDSFAPCQLLSNQNFLIDESIDLSSVFALPTATELAKTDSIDFSHHAVTFAQLPTMNQSQEQVHGDKKRYACDQCNKRFIKASYLKRHQLIHTGEKHYPCTQCPKFFRYSGDLTRHERIHTGEKPYQCDTCNTRFTKASILKEHKRTHTGEKPYQCDTCNKRFTKASILKEHKRTHTGEKPYQCNQCDYRCSQSSHLTIHQLIHTGEKPYQCSQCHYRSTQLSNLKRHEQKNHPIGTQLPHYQNLQQPSAISTNQVEQSPLSNGTTETTDSMELESRCPLCGNDTETCKCEQPLS